MDIDELITPAAVVARMLSTAICAASSFHRCVSLAIVVSSSGRVISV